MISFNKKSQNTKFYFSQEFRNRQIKTIYNILKLPITNENNIFINQLLINNNNDLYNFYFPKKPFYINNKDFLSRLGNKGIVETTNQILELLKEKEKQDQEKIKELQEKSKSLNEELTRPKFSSLEYSDEKNPDEILNEKIKERKLFDKTIPNLENHKTPEDVGLVPIQIKKKGKYGNNTLGNNSTINNSFGNNTLGNNPMVNNSTINNSFGNNQILQQQNNVSRLDQQFKETQDTINNQNKIIKDFVKDQNKIENTEKQKIEEMKEIKDLKNIDLTYNSSEFLPTKPKGDIDFSQPIKQELLMENINEGYEDNNYSAF